MVLAKQSILIVDDEPDILGSLYDTFIGDYEVYKASSAVEAIAVLKEKTIDLVLTDQRMPGMSGSELLANVDANYPNMGKILLTGYSDISSTIEAINKGNVDKYLTKPWDNDQIRRIVMEVLQVRMQRMVADRNSVETQLVQSAKMAAIGELAAGVAHEINNPVGFIHSNMGNLRKFFQKISALIEFYDTLPLPPDVLEEIQKIKTDINYDYLKTRIAEMIERSIVGAERIQKIILDLRSFSRKESLEAAEADINEAIDTTSRFLTYEYKERINISKDFGTLPKVVCNIGKLNQVFLNILANACQAIEDTGEVRIKTLSEGDKVRIELSDTGSGIPKDKINKIFETFYTTKPVGKGTGLGLSISLSIIKQHKGTISVQSEPGKGTTFTIILPVDGRGQQ
ncbi:MAG: ATP-binding protein [Candidatus Magnetominusculus sp. LBB02]|nr:ATP-binding protein [Candidatus Magnetominusculus sp. LBB02]